VLDWRSASVVFHGDHADLPTKKPRRFDGARFRGVVRAQWSTRESKLRDSPQQDAIDEENSHSRVLPAQADTIKKFSAPAAAARMADRACSIRPRRSARRPPGAGARPNPWALAFALSRRPAPGLCLCLCASWPLSPSHVTAKLGSRAATTRPPSHRFRPIGWPSPAAPLMLASSYRGFHERG
jgi:hypothetical protein